MKFLNPPLSNLKPEYIFELCVNGFSDEDKKSKLLSCKQLVETDSKNYQKLIPKKIDSFCKSDLPANVTSKEMKSVYDRKFAAADSDGRKYYNTIISQAEHGICPICGIRMVSTLDHYLPKAKVPTLVVTPSNLIPACRDCNMDKKADMVLDPKQTPVHLYFDRLPDDIWLYVTVGSNMEIQYYISCPDTWDDSLRCRVEKHLETYNLHTLYSSHAATEIADKQLQWRELQRIGSDSDIFKDIHGMRISTEARDLNSWKAALYRGLEQEFDKVKNWLLSNSASSSNT